MSEILKRKVVETYSKVIHPVNADADYGVCFDGSQKPFELFTAWDILSETIAYVPTPTFLEVGAFKGLWAIAFLELCKLSNKHGIYKTITWMEQNPDNKSLLDVIQYCNQHGLVAELIDANSQLADTKSKVLLPYGDKYDIVLIDADHTYNGAKKDIELYQPLARNLVFHDIRPIEPTDNCGVYQAIKDSGIVLDHEIACGGDMMGIGIKFYV